MRPRDRAGGGLGARRAVTEPSAFFESLAIVAAVLVALYALIFFAVPFILGAVSGPPDDEDQSRG